MKTDEPITKAILDNNAEREGRAAGLPDKPQGYDYRRGNLENLDSKLHPSPPLDRCTSQFTTQYGIPCRHELLERYKDGKLVLKKEDFHPYWWLERSLADEDEYLRYQEFDQVEQLRGRPRHSQAFASDPRAPRSTAPISTQTSVTETAPSRTTRLLPPICRQLSEWEGVDLGQEDLAERPTNSQSQSRLASNRGGRGKRGRKMGPLDPTRDVARGVTVPGDEFY